MKFALPEIRHNMAGFEALIKLDAEVGDRRFSRIEIDMVAASWFDADMCAPFGAILYRIGHHGNAIELTNLQSGVEKILSKNGFLSHYGHMPVRDTYGPSVPI